MEKNSFKFKTEHYNAAAAAKSLQSCPTLCQPIDGSPAGFPIPGILDKNTGWVSISFSNAWKWKVKAKSLSRIRLLAIPRTAAYQAPLSMGFSRQEYWSGVPLPSLNTMNIFSNSPRYRNKNKLPIILKEKCDLFIFITFKCLICVCHTVDNY